MLARRHTQSKWAFRVLNIKANNINNYTLGGRPLFKKLRRRNQYNIYGKKLIQQDPVEYNTTLELETFPFG